MLSRVLFVDDDPLILASFKRAFRGRFDLTTCQSGREALDLARNAAPFATVVADMQMPGMNGVEFLQEFAKIQRESSRIMLTGQVDQDTAVEAVNRGSVFRFLNKPCTEESLGVVIEAGITQYQLVTAERMLLEDTLAGSIQTMVELLTEFDPRSFGETRRVREYALQVASKLGLQAPWDLGVAALLSKMGRLAIPMEVQLKAAHKERLTVQQQDLFRKVPEIGSRMIANIPRLQSVAKFIYYSAKDYNGSGYPFDGVAGEDLPLESRILRVVDDFVAMLSIRKSPAVVVAQLMLDQGKYDPKVLEALERVVVEASDLGADQHRSLVAVDKLRIGMLLAVDVNTAEGLVLLSAGTRLSGILIEKLRTASSLAVIESNLLILSLEEGVGVGARA